MKKFLKLMNHSKVKMVIILTFLFFVYTTICAISYANNVSTDIADSVFRLHVIANSNSDVDQNLKYTVRDKLLEYMNTLCADCTSKKEAISIANEHIEDFKQIALDTIKNEGFNYSVNVQIGNFEFPTKHYGDISLPSGYYDALRVEIGEAKGQNWWCVMFPPLCFTDVSSGIVPEESKEDLENALTDEEFSIVSDNDSNFGFQLKFKILEISAPPKRINSLIIISYYCNISIFRSK